MINETKVNIATKNAFEQSVYAQFPTSLHEQVEHQLFYHGVELERGDMTMQTFMKGVDDTVSLWDGEAAQKVTDTAMFEGIKALLEDGTFQDPSLVAELTHEIELGEDSLLARFIALQPVKSSLDAALSFLAWKHMKVLVEIEEAFDVNLDHFRSTKEAEFYCTSESNMSLINFSVMSQ